MVVRELPEVICKPLLKVIDNLWLCVRLTDSFCHRTDPTIHMSYLTDTRRWAQAKLLSLPDPLDDVLQRQCSLSELNIYKLIRLSTNIFSLIAVFPISLSTAPFERLSSELWACLQVQPQALSLTEAGGCRHRLILWIATMGALASIRTPHNRQFFVSMCRYLTRHLHLKSWQEMQAVLQHYLWYSEVSGFDGQFLWLEIQSNEMSNSRN